MPLNFFEQIARCVEEGHLVSIDQHPKLPRSFVAQPPQIRARCSFFAGELNACFEAESQRRTHAWFDRQEPNRHTLHIVPDYGQLDIFMGAHSARDVFPQMLEELARAGRDRRPGRTGRRVTNCSQRNSKPLRSRRSR